MEALYQKQQIEEEKAKQQAEADRPGNALPSEMAAQEPPSAMAEALRQYQALLNQEESLRIQEPVNGSPEIKSLEAMARIDQLEPPIVPKQEDFARLESHIAALSQAEGGSALSFVDTETSPQNNAVPFKRMALEGGEKIESDTLAPTPTPAMERAQEAVLGA
jgi:hypothetical protein